MRVLVVGGSGLFGKKSVLALLRDPDVEGVVTMDVAPPMGYFTTLAAPHGDRFKYVKGDVSDLEQVLAVASENKVDAIINWAMILSKDPYPRENTKIGVLGMCNVFETARLLGIKRVVFASSETVYGEQSDYGDREIVEDDRLMPFQGSFYALAKTLSEVIAAEYDQLYGIKSTALRPTIGYGHGGLGAAVDRHEPVGRPLIEPAIDAGRLAEPRYLQPLDAEAARLRGRRLLDHSLRPGDAEDAEGGNEAQRQKHDAACRRAASRC